jgi:hypothetical protein
MTKKRRNPAAVALGRLGGLATAGAGMRARTMRVKLLAEPVEFVN